MGVKDANRIRELQQRFQREYESLLEQEGFSLAVGFGPGQEQGGYTLEVRLTPHSGNLEACTLEQKERITKEVLPEVYEGTPVSVRYVVVTARRS